MWVKDSECRPTQGHGQRGCRPVSSMRPWPLTEVRLIRAAFQPHALRGALDEKVPDQLIGQVSSCGERFKTKKEFLETRARRLQGG